MAKRGTYKRTTTRKRSMEELLSDDQTIKQRSNYLDGLLRQLTASGRPIPLDRIRPRAQKPD
jgi:hypothetical protein